MDKKTIDQDFIAENYSSICNYISTIINNHDEAQDLAQELFLDIWQRRDSIDIQDVDRYLLRAAKYKAIDYLRKNKNYINIDENSNIINEGSFDPYDLKEEDIEPMFVYYVSKLPPKTREVFMLSRVEGLTYQEISNRNNVSVKTIENQIGSALKTLRSLLRSYFWSIL